MSKVLIVEDNLSIASMYEFKLKLDGYEVMHAPDGKHGLRLSEEFQPDLILLDIRMPEMNGDDMLEQLRSKEWGGPIRIVILTNISKDEAPQKLRFLNVDRYIVKAHHTPAQVVKIVEEILAPKAGVK